MTEPIFSQKRTRSQLTLPDDILQIPDRSPLKGARTALRNHTITHAAPSSSKTPSDESDDELLLSPGKKPPMERSSSSKRSASPPPQDEYSVPSGSPPERRELKRVKRDGILAGEAKGDIDHFKPTFPFHERLTLGHSRNHSEPNLTLGRHSARKQPATKPKKPASAASASPPPTTFSPVPDLPKMTRALSLPPIFPAPGDIPHIDLRNPPLSPKRRRSPSRSPSRERGPKLRITVSGSSGSAGTPKLPTIHDDIIMDIGHSESESSIPAGSGTRSIPVEPHVPISQEEIIPASPPSREMVPASPPMRQTVLPSSPHTREIIPASPSPPPSNSMDLAPPTTLTVPATPATQSLSHLISMSPLTPLPETPLPPRSMDSSVDDRFSSNMGWGIIPMKELIPPQPNKPQPAATPSTTQSRLPRPSVAAPAVTLSKPSRATMAPPPTLPPSKKTTAPTVNTEASTSTPKESKDALKLLMSNAKSGHTKREEQQGKLGQTTDKGKKPMQKSLFMPGPSLKQKQPKVKQKMRPREKPEPEKALVIMPLPDEDEEEERNEEGPWQWGSKYEPEVKTTVADAATAEVPQENRPASVSSELSTALSTDSTAMNETPDTSSAGDQLASDIRTVEDGTIQEHDEPATVLSQPPQPGPITTAEDIPSEVPLGKEVQEDEPLVEASVPPANTETTTTEADKNELPETTEPRPPSRTGKSKLPLGKKRQPVSTAAPARVTRSASNRKNDTAAESSKSGIGARKKPVARPKPATSKRAIGGPAKKPAPAPAPALAIENGEDVPMDTAEEQEVPLPPGSPMKTSSPIRSSPRASTADKGKDEQSLQVPVRNSSAASTPTRSKSRVPSASPSPTKIARSTLMAMRPTAASIARTFPSNQLSSAASSSLSTLSNALEKLRMPPPSRPNTSMGFNRDIGADDDNADIPARSKDDAAVGRASVGIGKASGGGGAAVQRSATLGSTSFKPKSTSGIASSSKFPAATGKNLVQKPLSMFMSSKGGTTKPNSIGAGVRRMALPGKKAPVFGVGGGLGRKISKKTTLPVVLGSPVKGGQSNADVDESLREYNEAAADEDEEEGGSIFNAIVNGSSATHLLENLLAEGSDKGKEKETSSKPVHSSRRVSMLSRDLTHSLSALPPVPPVASSSSSGRGQMGPPPTPPSGGRSVKEIGSSPSSSPSQGGLSGAKRSSARIAKNITAAKASNEGTISAGKKGAVEAPNPAVEALKVLKDCVIFVDVKNEDGDEAGSLFVEMLEGVGARVLTRVGQSCTHVVFKNGLMSTITRWKLLRDPKPKVVGIGWVVECIEQRKQVDETDFLIDLTHTNVAGTHKRRRSMLPKLFAEEEPEKDESVDGDRSVDGSVSSITMDDDLTPLERARRRKSMLTGPRP